MQFILSPYFLRGGEGGMDFLKNGQKGWDKKFLIKTGDSKDQVDSVRKGG